MNRINSFATLTRSFVNDTPLLTSHSYHRYIIRAVLITGLRDYQRKKFVTNTSSPNPIVTIILGCDLWRAGVFVARLSNGRDFVNYAENSFLPFRLKRRWWRVWGRRRLMLSRPIVLPWSSARPIMADRWSANYGSANDPANRAVGSPRNRSAFRARAMAHTNFSGYNSNFNRTFPTNASYGPPRPHNPPSADGNYCLNTVPESRMNGVFEYSPKLIFLMFLSLVVDGRSSSTSNMDELSSLDLSISMNSSTSSTNRIQLTSVPKFETEVEEVARQIHTIWSTCKFINRSIYFHCKNLWNIYSFFLEQIHFNKI